MKINDEALLSGAKQIHVRGKCCTNERRQMVEEAMRYFIENPNPTRTEYFGIKQYAGFGDQRSDHTPGYGPKHGTIVFEIDFNREAKNLTIDDYGIMYLGVVLENGNLNIPEMLNKYAKAQREIEELMKEDLRPFNPNE